MKTDIVRMEERILKRLHELLASMCYEDLAAVENFIRQQAHVKRLAAQRCAARLRYFESLK